MFIIEFILTRRLILCIVVFLLTVSQLYHLALVYIPALHSILIVCFCQIAYFTCTCILSLLTLSSPRRKRKKGG